MMLVTLWLRQFKDFGGTTWWRRKICHQHDVSNIYGSEANVPVRIHLHGRAFRAFQGRSFHFASRSVLKVQKSVIRVRADKCLIALFQKQTTLQTAFSVIRFNFHLQLFTSFSCWWMILPPDWYFRKINPKLNLKLAEWHMIELQW